MTTATDPRAALIRDVRAAQQERISLVLGAVAEIVAILARNRSHHSEILAALRRAVATWQAEHPPLLPGLAARLAALGMSDTELRGQCLSSAADLLPTLTDGMLQDAARAAIAEPRPK